MDKMPFYEPPYPEETHYSHVLRLAKLNGFGRFLTFAEHYLTFNGVSRGADMRDSVMNLAPFFASADIQTPYSDYILNTTAYAYHSIFLNEYRSRKHLNKFYRTDDKFNYIVRTDKKELCFCPECMKDGAYFRRIHQIPNVTVCPIHGTLLLVCTNTRYHEYDELNGNLTDLVMPFDDEYRVSAFIHGMLKSDIQMTLNDYRNIVQSKVGDYTAYDDFATEYMSSGLSALFKDQKGVFNFIKAGMRQGKIPEGEAVGVLVFLFGSFDAFNEYYQQHKDDYVANAVDEGDFYTFIENEGYSLESDFRQDIITVSHDYCGRRFITSPSMLMDGWLCPHCHRRVDDAELQHRIVDYSGHGEYTFIKPADSLSNRIMMHHIRCDSDIAPTLDDFLFRGYRCKCHNKLLLSDAERMVKEKGDFELVKFKDRNSPASIKCSVCGNVLNYADFTFVYRPITCNFCHPKKRTLSTKKISGIVEGDSSNDTEIIYRNDINYARNIIYNLVGDEYSVIDFGKINNSGKYSVKVRHAECGEEYWTSYQGFLHGSRCKCEGHAVQASSEELKRYIKDLSRGEYTCVDDEITDRDHVRVQNTATGETKVLPYKMILQELKRITPSNILPCNDVNRNAIRPRSAPMLFMEHLRNAYGDDGVFFSRDLAYDAPKVWIASTLNMFLKQGLIQHIGTEIYALADVNPDWNEIARLFYIGQNSIRYGCTYGRSFLQDLGISMKHPPVHPHIMSNRKGRMGSAKEPSCGRKVLIRQIGPVTIRLKEAPCEITEDNYRVLQVADYLNSHHNQNYPYLDEEEMVVMSAHLKESPAGAFYDVIKLYPESVQWKMISMYEE